MLEQAIMDTRTINVQHEQRGFDQDALDQSGNIGLDNFNL